MLGLLLKKKGITSTAAIKDNSYTISIKRNENMMEWNNTKIHDFYHLNKSIIFAWLQKNNNQLN